MIRRLSAFLLSAVILVGTPDFDRILSPALREPLPYDNLMYVMHFYAASHRDSLKAVLMDAIDQDFPVFISECGISEDFGDGDLDYKSAASWFDLLTTNGISYAVWSFSNKNESSAMLLPGYDPAKPVTDDDLTPVGHWVKALISGTDPLEIPVHRERVIKTAWNYITSGFLSPDNIHGLKEWPLAALTILCVILVLVLIFAMIRTTEIKKQKIYHMEGMPKVIKKDRFEYIFSVLRIFILLSSMFFSMMYIHWRIRYSVPLEFGVIAIACNLILLAVEIVGFFESIILYLNLISLKNYPVPKIDPFEYPEVDIFIATYNEPTELLKRTINGCTHLLYPDKSKVHIWVCDDNRREEMRQLAESMNVGYFDRPDNKGAKAGNLNHAMSLTNAPYIITLDADMIVKSDFLLKTIPYFVKAKKDNVKLGLLQTPQCFYEPDVFQHALYSEKNAPNEQDFFYRTIEVAKTSSNSVIYGGSNTVISRQALEDIGGFYTGSITEDFATGVLIESKGYVSLGLSEPLASGKTPDFFNEHIKQRIRWGRGVISTARQLRIFRMRDLNISQKLSYWSSVSYWYSPIKNLIYILSPLMFAIFGIPVFKCTLVDLLIYWVPMFIMQDLCLRFYSSNCVSLKWSGIYETSVMPFLLVPIIKEFFGISLTKFAVTDKSGKNKKRRSDKKAMAPFLILIILSVIAIVRVLFMIRGWETFGIFILIFWIVRNLYYLTMSLFLVDGRDRAVEEVKVVDAEPAELKDASGNSFYGITTSMTDHSLCIYLDETADIRIGDRLDVHVDHGQFFADVHGVVTGITDLINSSGIMYAIEILDFKGNENEYDQVLFDRIPSLPQSLHKDLGILTHLLKIVAHRILDV